MSDALLRDIFKQHLSQAIKNAREAENIDRKALDAIANGFANPENICIVKSWLGKYRVRRGLKSQEKVVGEVFNFTPPQMSVGEAEFASTCVNLLMEKLREIQGRRLPSLCSKALWLKYPHRIPIYDSHVLRALDVLARIFSVTVDNGDPVARYYKLWFHFYNVFKQVAGQSEERGKYPLREFDKLLWSLGKPCIYEKQ